jgi:hypothetical protein
LEISRGRKRKLGVSDLRDGPMDGAGWLTVSRPWKQAGSQMKVEGEAGVASVPGQGYSAGMAPRRVGSRRVPPE